jgi:hypothetical protein
MRDGLADHQETPDPRVDSSYGGGKNESTNEAQPKQSDT